MANLQTIRDRVEAAGWAIADSGDGWIKVWHSNGDDQAHFTNVNGEWFTYAVDRNDSQLDDVTPLAHSGDVADAILQRLAAWDPICETCGFQGHDAAHCDMER